MHRTTVGIVALASLACAAGVYFLGSDQALTQQFLAGLLKLGAVAAVIWLALPDVERGNNTFLLVSIVAIAVVIVVRAKLLLIVLPALVLFYILLPRNRAKR